MGNAVSGRRTLLSGTAVLAAVALIALGSALAQADETEPDLGVRGLTPVTGITPGSGFGLPVSLLNKGTEELPKAYVTYSFSSGLATAETYSNCLYSTIGSYDEMPERHRAVCTVDQPLKPGVLYGTEKPIGLKAGRTRCTTPPVWGCGRPRPGPTTAARPTRCPAPAHR